MLSLIAWIKRVEERNLGALLLYLHRAFVLLRPTPERTVALQCQGLPACKVDTSGVSTTIECLVEEGKWHSIGIDQHRFFIELRERDALFGLAESEADLLYLNSLLGRIDQAEASRSVGLDSRRTVSVEASPFCQ